MSLKRKISVLVLAAVLMLSAMPMAAFAEGEDCGCGTSLTGAEKNKLVSNLIKSEAFKAKKKELQEQGYGWQGVSGAEVERHNESGELLIAIPLLDPRGNQIYLISIFGTFILMAPPQ